MANHIFVCVCVCVCVDDKSSTRINIYGSENINDKFDDSDSIFCVFSPIQSEDEQRSVRVSERARARVLVGKYDDKPSWTGI